MDREAGRVDGEHRRVRGVVLAEDLRGARGPVLQRDGDGGGRVDHVRGGDDVALAVDEEAVPVAVPFEPPPNGDGLVAPLAVMSTTPGAAAV